MNRATLFFAAFFCLAIGIARSEPLHITVHPAPAKANAKKKLVSKAGPVPVTRMLREAARTPGSATVATEKEWSAQKAATIKDITDYVPGVYAQPRNGAESSRLSIRGSGLASTFQGRGLLVMQDGVPINMADGEFEFPVIDPWLTKYAEVLPGANALAEGASTLGGAINFITADARSEHGLQLRTEAGSFGTLQGLVSEGWEGKNAAAFAAASGLHQDGFREHNRQDTGRFNGNVDLHPAIGDEAHFVISHTVARPEIPGAISLAVLSTDPTQANPANVAGDYRRDLDITRVSASILREQGPTRLESLVYYTYRTLDNPVTTYIIEHNNDVGSRTKISRSQGDATWTGGLNLAFGTQDETRFTNAGGVPGIFILDRDLDAVTAEAYGQYQRPIVAHLSGIAALQGSYDTRNIAQQAPGPATQDRRYAGLNPRLGLLYDSSPTTQFFANLSRSFEPPTWAELSGGNAPGFHDLSAQHATTAEIGGRGMARGIRWSAAFYHSWLRNEFVNYEFASGATDTINAPRTVHAGAELGLDGDILNDRLFQGDAVAVRAAYTLNHFRMGADPLYQGKRLPGMPEHYLRGEVLYWHPSGVSIGPNLEAASRYPVDLANSFYAPGYVIWGARILFRPAEGGEFWVDGRNLANRHYVATTNVIPDAHGADGRFFYPGEGRAIYAGMRLKF